MLTSDNIQNLIQKAVESLNADLSAEQQIEVGPETVLFGLDSKIDSLALVSVVVDIETELNGEHNLEISLTDDRAMTRAVSPFTTVASLRDYIVELLEEKR